MIINLKKYKEHGYLKAIGLMFFKVFINSKHNLLEETKVSFKTPVYGNYPQQKFDVEGQWNCTSCYLCSDVCPTNCIAITGDKNQGSLAEGPRPKSYKIELKDCTQCKLCVDICPTAALDLNGVYTNFDFNLPLDFKESVSEQL